MPASADLPDIAAFLSEEAWLLDDRRFNEWIGLFIPECRYWMPLEEGICPDTEMSIILDDRRNLASRIARLADPGTHSQNPASETTRIVTNVQVGEPAADGTVPVRSRFVLYENRLGATRSYAGRYLHSLVRQDGGWAIAEKKILLVSRRDTLPSITFLW